MKQRVTNNKSSKKRIKRHENQKVKKSKSSSLFPTTTTASSRTSNESSLVSSIFGNSNHNTLTKNNDSDMTDTTRTTASTSNDNGTTGFDLFSTQKANQLSKVIQERMNTNQNQLNRSCSGSRSRISTKKEEDDDDDDDDKVSKVKIANVKSKTEKCTKHSNRNKMNDNDDDNNNDNDRDTILEYRKKRNLNQEYRNIIDSISITLPDFIDSNDDDEYDDDDKCDKEVSSIIPTTRSLNGIQRLFTKQADAIMRENGVLIVKSNDGNVDINTLSSSSIVPTTTTTTKHIFNPSLLQTMSFKAKEIENKICTKLQQRGHIWEEEEQQHHTHTTKTSSSSSSSSSSILQQSNEQKHAFQYHEVASRCFGRLDIRYQMNQKPYTQPNIITNTYIYPIIQSLLGPNATLLYVGLILSFPNSVDQPWHQDGTLLFDDADDEKNENESFRNDDVHLPPYALNVFIPLEDVTEDVGPTEFHIGSHYAVKAKRIMEGYHATVGTTTTTNSEVEENQYEVEEPIGPLLKCGDVLIYDYRVCHRGTKNLSFDKTRPMLYLMYARPWFQEHLNFGKECLFDE